MNVNDYKHIFRAFNSTFTNKRLVITLNYLILMNKGMFRIR